MLSDYAVTDSQKCNLDLKVAKFFYANNVAFNVVSNNAYKEIVKVLRPGYFEPN